MNIVVCCKSVPGVVTDVVVAEDGKSLVFQSQFSAMNECDEYAIEEALVLKEEFGGEITAITIGPMRTQDLLYQALAKGADKAIRVDAEIQDSKTASTILAAVLEGMDFDLVLTGTQARDTLSSYVGVAVAEKLNLPYAFAVVEAEKAGETELKIKKELGGGRFAVVKLTLPSVICVQTGIQPLSFVPPAKVMRARQKPLKTISVSDLNLTETEVQSEGYKIDSVFPPERQSKIEFIEGAPPEIAATVMDRIREAL